MWPDSEERTHLEDVFGILRFRRRDLCSFRRFVILSSMPDTNEMRVEEVTTQPLRVLHP
jgi:hypothetical protein